MIFARTSVFHTNIKCTRKEEKSGRAKYKREAGIFQRLSLLDVIYVNAALAASGHIWKLCPNTGTDELFIGLLFKQMQKTYCVIICSRLLKYTR